MLGVYVKIKSSLNFTCVQVFTCHILVTAIFMGNKVRKVLNNSCEGPQSLLPWFYTCKHGGTRGSGRGRLAEEEDNKRKQR